MNMSLELDLPVQQSPDESEGNPVLGAAIEGRLPTTLRQLVEAHQHNDEEPLLPIQMPSEIQDTGIETLTQPGNADASNPYLGITLEGQQEEIIATKMSAEPLLMEPSSPHFFSPRTDVLTLSPSHITQIDALSSLQNLQGIILFVDDSVVHLKIRVPQLVKYLIENECDTNPVLTHLKALDAGKWQRQGLTVDSSAHWGVICAENAHIAFEIVKNWPSITILITDHQLPTGTWQGLDLVRAIRAFEATEMSRSFLPIALNSSQAPNEIMDVLDTLGALNATYIHKSSKLIEYHTFIDRALMRGAQSLLDEENTSLELN